MLLNVHLSLFIYPQRHFIDKLTHHTLRSKQTFHHSPKNVIDKIVRTLPTKFEVCEVASLQDREELEGKERI
jgi:hypothetical protein